MSAPDSAFEPTSAWAGQQRLFVIARASAAGGGASAILTSQAGPLVQANTTAAIGPIGLDWGLYDLGTYSLRASEYPQANVEVQATLTTVNASAALDVGAFVMLPDANTWFCQPTQIVPSQYGWPPTVGASWGVTQSPWTNTFVIDDVLGDQFIYAGQSQTFAPSPVGSVPSSARITPYTRGLIPQPDPKGGLPVIAILGVGQTVDPTLSPPLSFPTYDVGPLAGASATNDSSSGTVAWSSPGNATALDGVFATVTCNGGQTSEWLKVMDYGFAIPSNATILGVQVTNYFKTVNLGSGWSSVDTLRLVKAGTIQSGAATTSGSGGVYSGNELYGQVGSSSDLWGGTWGPSDINNSSFGVAIQTVVSGSGTAELEIDYLSIQVWYTYGSPPVATGVASQANPQNLRTMAQVFVQERFRYIAS